MVSVVAAIGRRSITLGVEIRAPKAGTVYATTRTVVVGGCPLTEARRAALAAVGLTER